MIFPTNPQRPLNLKTHLRTVRTVHFMILIAAIFQLYILYTLRKNNPPHGPALDSSVAYTIVLAAIVSFGVIVMVRRYILDKAVAALRNDPTDSISIQRWGGAMIVTSSGCEAAFLFGWVLCFMGTPLTWTYILLWSIAALGFVVFIPQMPIDEMSVLLHNSPPGP